MEGGIVFLGTDGEFSFKPLCALIDAGVPVAGIVRGNRGKRITRPLRRLIAARTRRRMGLRQFAKEIGVPFLDVDKKTQRRLAERLAKLEPDLLCVASFPFLLTEEVLRIPRQGAVNMHASLLPYYPGPNPIVSMIMHGEKRWGVTIHAIDQGEDTGPLIRQGTIQYSQNASGQVLFQRLIECGARLMVDGVQEILSGKSTPQPQAKIANRRRGKRLAKGEPTIELKGTAQETQQFLTQLLFFATPQLAVGNERYLVRRLAGFIPGNTGLTNTTIEPASTWFARTIRCRFPDGEILLSVKKLHGISL